MSSPRTMFTGVIQIGPMISIACTIGKATGDDSERLFVEVCQHEQTTQRISRKEYCKQCHGRPLNKKLAIEIDDHLKILSESDLEAIDEADGGSTLKVLDVQPVAKLPLLYSMGTYYLRHNDKAKVSPDPMATLAAALMVERLALIVKWKRKLSVITAERGILVLRLIPYLENVRVASKRERAHMSGKVSPKAVSRLGELLGELQNPKGFDYASYHDDGLAQRQAVVDRIVRGEKPRKAPPKKIDEPIDFEKLIDQAIADVRSS